MVKGKKWVLKRHFSGAPKLDDFELVEEEMPELKDGEFMYRSLYISVDPYQRPYTDRIPVPCTMIGSSVAVVEKSKNPEYPEGAEIVVYGGWVQRAVCNPKNLNASLGPPWVYPKVPGLTPSMMLGVCGMPGATAYFGLLDICEPKAGETVVVSGAAGAVGSLVGQIAKIKGCKVIGFAGTDEKVAWLKEIGYDYAYNYKKTSVDEALKESATQGVDCYFDNVGGNMSAAILMAMNKRGRVSVCGSICNYNEAKRDCADLLPLLVFKELKVEGFLVGRWIDQFQQAVAHMAHWVMEKKISVRETVVDGFENTPQAFFGLFDGSNTGKMLVKV